MSCHFVRFFSSAGRSVKRMSFREFYKFQMNQVVRTFTGVVFPRHSEQLAWGLWSCCYILEPWTWSVLSFTCVKHVIHSVKNVLGARGNICSPNHGRVDKHVSLERPGGYVRWRAPGGSSGALDASRPVLPSVVAGKQFLFHLLRRVPVPHGPGGRFEDGRLPQRLFAFFFSALFHARWVIRNKALEYQLQFVQ